eukprot:2108682-Lingulodinium_polyedra.AAC.1
MAAVLMSMPKRLMVSASCLGNMGACSIFEPLSRLGTISLLPSSSTALQKSLSMSRAYFPTSFAS